MKTIAITGGTGTFGKAFVRYVYQRHSDKYRKIVIFSRDEFKQFHMKNEIDSLFPNNNVRYIVGDVRDKERLKVVFDGVDQVINAAALKHVPVCEYNPQEAIKTNINGVVNVCEAAIECGIDKVIQLSTDKAVEPINLYGATKMAAEKYVVQANSYSKKTALSCVRYGNIMGSRGSLLGIFQKQLEAGEPFTITDKHMTRFWMHIDDAVAMVFWALNAVRPFMAMSGGEIVLPQLRSSLVVDVAKVIANSHPIEYTGIRPGEKMHEQLVNRSERYRTYKSLVGDYYLVLPESLQWRSLDYYTVNFDDPIDTGYWSNDSDRLMSFAELMDMVHIWGNK